MASSGNIYKKRRMVRLRSLPRYDSASTITPVQQRMRRKHGERRFSFNHGPSSSVRLQPEDGCGRSSRFLWSLSVLVFAVPCADYLNGLKSNDAARLDRIWLSTYLSTAKQSLDRTIERKDARRSSTARCRAPVRSFGSGACA